MFETHHHAELPSVPERTAPAEETEADLRASLEASRTSSSESLRRAEALFSDEPATESEPAEAIAADIRALNDLIGNRTHAEIEALDDERREALEALVGTLFTSAEQHPKTMLVQLVSIHLPEVRFAMLKKAFENPANYGSIAGAREALARLSPSIDDGSEAAAETFSRIKRHFDEDEAMQADFRRLRAEAEAYETNRAAEIEAARQKAETYERVREELSGLREAFAKHPLATIEDRGASEAARTLLLNELPTLVWPLLESERFDDTLAILSSPDVQSPERQTPIIKAVALHLLKKGDNGIAPTDIEYTKRLFAFKRVLQIGSAPLKRLFMRVPESIQGIGSRAEMPADKAAIASALTEPFYPRNETGAYENYHLAHIEASRASRAEAVAILSSLPNGDLRDRQLKNAFDYCLDPDFGDLADARAIANLHSVPSEREKWLASLPTELSQAETFKARHMPEWRERSRENRLATEADLAEYFGAERVAELIRTIESTSFLTINATPNAVQKILDSGSVQSAFDPQASSTRRSSSYHDARHLVETRLGIRAKGTKNDPHAVYAAFGHANGRDESRGAAPSYGDCVIRLKPQVRQRCVYTYGDSFAGDVKLRQFVGADVAVAKAKLELDGVDAYGERTPYVESQILGGVNADDIEAISLRINRSHSSEKPAWFEAYKERFPHIDFSCTEE